MKLREVFELQSRDKLDTGAVQAVHDEPTPRLGGVGIFIALWVAASFVPTTMREPLLLLLVSTFPVFIVGLVEDLKGGVRPRTRLIAAAISSAIAIILLGEAIMRVDVPMLDTVIAIFPIAVVFTIFTTTGVSNAFNLIDGLNGLSAAAALLALTGLTSVAMVANLDSFSQAMPAVAAAILGFLLVNYPYGKLFLGDSGAYSVGHILSWLAIVVLFRVPDFTTWAVLLIFFWPMADTLFAIYRRARTGVSANEPDRRHHHHLFLEYISLSPVGRRWPHLANSASALAMLPFMAAPVLTGVIFWNDPLFASIAVGVFTILFVVSYNFGLRILGDPSQRSEVLRRIETLDMMTSRRVKRRVRAFLRLILARRRYTILARRRYTSRSSSAGLVVAATGQSK